ncbi:sterol carrier family protein [Brevibacterium luteolum]|uniref:Bacterial SCP orthologue domain-containing protein n=1 Tax=Brevibacterium luteolum TaxID=199591 RepID=A0A6G8KWZ5_9MICO|nr:sterol carrier family protein [Brevibacterium luteolum]QIN29337.1 hypothetical protein EW640_08655 [Brevibacterium luteolum]
MSIRRRIDQTEGRAALARWEQARRTGAEKVERATLAMAVRYTLEELAARHAGGTVEVRIPPFGVTQCIAGPKHTRGTPPNVIETDPETWLKLAIGELSFADAQAADPAIASGTRADLSQQLPLFTAAELAGS